MMKPLTKEGLQPGVRVRCVEDDGSISLGSIFRVDKDDHPSNPYPPDPRFSVEWDGDGGAIDWYWFKDVDELKFEVINYIDPHLQRGRRTADTAMNK